LAVIPLHGQKDSILSRINFEMDYRFRAEQDWDSRKSDGTFRADRSRLRYRLRTGATYSHSWYSFGFRLRTGDLRKQQDPQLTLGTGLKEFGTLPVGFEKAYFQFEHKNLKSWMGKNTYPFQKNNELLWSDNVFTEGVMMSYRMGIPSKRIESINITGGHFIIASNNEAFSGDAYFQGIQAAIASKGKRIELFPSIYFFRNIPDIPDGAHTFLLDYSILHLGARLKLINNHKLFLALDYYENFSNYNDNSNIVPALSDQKTGYTLGVQYGDLKEARRFMGKLTYAYLERFSNLDYMAQNDWARWDYSGFDSPDGRLSNLWGIEAVLAYAISEKVNLVSKYYLVEQLVPYGAEKETGQRLSLIHI